LEVDARPVDGSESAFPSIFPSHQGKLELAMKARLDLTRG